MKYLKSVFCIFTLGLCLVLSLGFNAIAQDFEGVIHYQFDKMEQQNMDDIQYMIKNGKIRMEFGMGPQSGAMLYKPDESKMTFIMDQMKSYMSMDMTDMSQESNYDSKWDKSEVEKTGQTKEIAGHDCEIWNIANDNDEKLTMCMANDLGTFMTPGNPMAKQNAPDWAKEIIAEGFMPLEVIEQSGGNETVQMRATKIEEKSLSDELFEVPQGYRDMSGMMKQMMKQRNN
ncbi:DUF4412 domain-containing protein [Fodinibius salsisoli]|uniref:DUF4412 domain-containing protein n=1 Tax=Fodinibius salsisoli TaxID=2820877 RepID=A0ABT3PP41_9BACT|nr:DUF4412 domain-containing protein [Fodinibius salsisoli]MCW9707626.1 DUF4412 domain-containing protein [Fodinibius salsisoli]